MSLERYAAIQTEINDDPLTRNYAGMTDDEIVVSLNTQDRDFWVTLTSAEIFQAVDLTELAALSVGNKARTDRIFQLTGDIQTGPGANARAELLSVFGGGSATVTNLAAAANKLIGRGEEIGVGAVRNRDLGRMRIEAAKGLI